MNYEVFPEVIKPEQFFIPRPTVAPIVIRTEHNGVPPLFGNQSGCELGSNETPRYLFADYAFQTVPFKRSKLIFQTLTD